MDLIEKNVNGTLDALAACKLLWAGALSFNCDDAKPDDHATTVFTPAINDGVLSLYSISHEEVAAIVPDLLQLLSSLEADEELRVEPTLLAPAVLEALSMSRLTGATLFLLQSGAHPLIVESAGRDCVRVRYDKKLARGIPRLQHLLCRMVCHLRSYNGEQGPLTILFAAGDNRGNSVVIKDFEGCVNGATELLEQRVQIADCTKVNRFYLRPFAPNTAGNNTSPIDMSSPLNNEDVAQEADLDAAIVRTASTLESSAYTMRALADATDRRIKDLEATLERVEQAQPNAKAYKSSTSMPKDLPTNATASRSLVLRSLLYIAIGITLLALGSKCITQNVDVSAWIMRLVDGAFERAHDFIGLVFGQFGQVGTRVTLGFPADSLAGPVRVAGYVLMAAGILFPVRKILKHNRRLKRELALHKSHVDYMSTLVAKKHMNDEIAYAQSLETWSAKLKSLETSIDYAKRSYSKIDQTSDKLTDTLATYYASTRLLPKSAQNLPATCTLFDYINTGRCSRLDGPNGALAKYKEDLLTARIDVDPSQATTLQPTLRTAARTCASILQSVEAQFSEKERYHLIVEHCDKVTTTLSIAQAG